MSLNLNEEYILSIANELVNFSDAIPTKVQNVILDNDPEDKFRKARRSFLWEDEKARKNTSVNRRNIISLKSREEKIKAYEMQVADFIDKYPKYKKIIN